MASSQSSMLKSQKPKAKSQKPKAKSQKPKAKSQKPKAKSQKPKASGLHGNFENERQWRKRVLNEKTEIFAEAQPQPIRRFD